MLDLDALSSKSSPEHKNEANVGYKSPFEVVLQNAININQVVAQSPIVIVSKY